MTEYTSGSPDLRRLPTAVRCAWRRGAYELTCFARNKTSLVFTLALPVLTLTVLGSILTGKAGDSGVDIRQILIAGSIAAGIMSVSFTGLAITMAMERGDGTLRRLSRTPMPMSSYFIGKALLVVVTGIAEAVLILAVSVSLLGLDLPVGLFRWAVLVGVLVLGALACSLVGIAYSTLVPSPRAAAAMVTPPFLLLQFISGVFFPFGSLPVWMRTFASLFPLRWMALGMRSALLDDRFRVAEPTGSWERGKTFVVLGLWCLGGLTLAIAAFRRRRPR